LLYPEEVVLAGMRFSWHDCLSPFSGCFIQDWLYFLANRMIVAHN
jgi:hypothetical protein